METVLFPFLSVIFVVVRFFHKRILWSSVKLVRDNKMKSIPVEDVSFLPDSGRNMMCLWVALRAAPRCQFGRFLAKNFDVAKRCYK